MRDASTYRAARRNYCFNDRLVWGPQFYFARHRNDNGRAARLAKRPLGNMAENAAIAAATVKGMARSIAAMPLRLRRGARGQ